MVSPRRGAWFCHNNACQPTCSRQGIISDGGKITRSLRTCDGACRSAQHRCPWGEPFCRFRETSACPGLNSEARVSFAIASRLIAELSDIVKKKTSKQASKLQEGNADDCESGKSVLKCLLSCFWRCHLHEFICGPKSTRTRRPPPPRATLGQVKLCGSVGGCDAGSLCCWQLQTVS